MPNKCPIGCTKFCCKAPPRVERSHTKICITVEADVWQMFSEEAEAIRSPKSTLVNRLIKSFLKKRGKLA